MQEFLLTHFSDCSGGADYEGVYKLMYEETSDRERDVAILEERP
jgi:hypothetical protein